MKKFIATAAACGASLFGLTGVAGAASPTPPNPNDAAQDQAVVHPCVVVVASNPNVQSLANFPGQSVGIFDGGQVDTAFCLGS